MNIPLVHYDNGSAADVDDHLGKVDRLQHSVRV